MGQIFLRKSFAQIYFFANAAGVNRKAHDVVVPIDYHYFYQDKISLEDLEVSLSTLEFQLNRFKKYCDILSMDEVINFISDEKPFSERPKIVITIDDADDSILAALPYFEKLQIPFTIFVPVGLCLDKNADDGLRSWIFRFAFEGKDFEPKRVFEETMALSSSQLQSRYEEMKASRTNADPISSRHLLTLQQLAKLIQNPLVTVGSHSMSHPVFSRLSARWAEWEIATSNQYLRGIGSRGDVFAYPYGAKGTFSKETEEILKRNGIKVAFTTMSSSISHKSIPTRLGRVGMHDIKSSTYLKGIARGAFEKFDQLLKRL